MPYRDPPGLAEDGAQRYGCAPMYEDDEEPLPAAGRENQEFLVHRYGLSYDYDDFADEPSSNYCSTPTTSKRKKKEKLPEDSDDSSDDDESSSDSSWDTSDDDEEKGADEGAPSQRMTPEDQEPPRNWNQELQELMDTFSETKRKTLAFEERNKSGDPIPPDEETLEAYQTQLALLSRLRQLSREFKKSAEDISQTIIDEMHLSNRRKTYRPRTELPGECICAEE